MEELNELVATGDARDDRRRIFGRPLRGASLARRPVIIPPALDGGADRKQGRRHHQQGSDPHPRPHAHRGGRSTI